MGKKTRKRKSTDQHLPVVTPKRSIGRGSDASPNQTTFKVDGAGLVEAFKHIKMGVPDLQNLWILSDDWCKIIPHYCSSIKNYKDQITTRKFTTGMNRAFGEIDMKNYYQKHKDGVYCNRYGKANKLYYLFTNDGEKSDNWGNIEVGPVLWSDEQRQYRTNVVCTENPTRTVQKNKDNLAADLQELNMFSKGTVAQLQQRCQNAGISLQKQVPNVLHEGFIKMSKGKFQILWERGFINPDRATWKRYTLEGPKDERGQIIKDYSLNHLMSLLPDFENEKTLLHHHGEALGCIIFNSPKCTPEIAGEGIEYDWGVSKLYYKAQDVERKRKRTNFKELVFEAIGERVLSLETVRSNAKRAREHMICYYELQKNGQDSAPSDVKRMMKLRKTHSCVVDMDNGFLSNRVRAILAAERGRQ